MIVVLSDLIICTASLSLAYLIRFDLKADDLTIEKEWNQVSKSLLLFFLIKVCVFYIFKIHQGLLRHTSMEDLKRIFYAVSVSSILFLSFGIIRFYYYDGFYLFPRSVLLIEYLACLLFMLGSRFFIKLIYLENLKIKEHKDNVLIFGAGISGVITKKTIEKDSMNKFQIKGFIDDNQKLVGNSIEGIKVFSWKQVEINIKKLHIKSIIIAIQKLDKKRQSEIVNFCLSNNISIQKVPNASSWVNGSLSVKQISNIKIEDLLGRDSIVLDFDEVNRHLKDKSILVTGAAGSIGTGLCKQIAQFHPKKMILLDQAESPLHDLQIELENLFESIRLDIVIGDICNKERMNKLFNTFEIDVVYHAAAYKHVPIMEMNPAESVLNNVKGTKIIADLSSQFNISKFVMISTDKAVNPTNVMGATKRIAEIYIQYLNSVSNTKFITTRFGNVLGSNGSVIPLFRKQISNGGPITVTDERVTRFFMTIPEACQLVLEAGTMGNGGEIYVFDMGKPIRIIDLAKKMIALSSLTLGVDIEIKLIGMRPGEKLFEELLTTEENTIHTHHQKILIAKTKMHNQSTIKLINELLIMVENQNNEELVQLMKKIVPEYVSNNSVYEKFDR